MIHLALISLLTALRVAFIGDPQVDNERELHYARESIFAELLERRDIDLVIIMGDLVNENPPLMPVCSKILDSLHCPWLRVHGNHDGKLIPNDTSLVINGLRVVLLHREDSPIPQAKDGEKTIYCSHYPFKSVPDSSANSLYVSAHLHTVFREMKGAAEHLGVGATCGTWWRGEKDKRGIPYALMNCGSPRGYFIADIDLSKDIWYKLQYKVVGQSPQLQADIHRQEGKIYINVYGGAADGVLEISHKGRWIKAERVEEIDPKVRAIIEKNRNTDRAYRKEHKELFIPMRRLPSPHLWAVEREELKKCKVLKIRYKDRNMKIVNTKLTIQ